MLIFRPSFMRADKYVRVRDLPRCHHPKEVKNFFRVVHAHTVVALHAANRVKHFILLLLLLLLSSSSAIPRRLLRPLPCAISTTISCRCCW